MIEIIIHVVEIDGETFEAGASIIHRANKYAWDFAHQFNLSVTTTHYKSNQWGLFDGNDIIISSSRSQAC